MHSKSILIVEDDADIRFSLQALLQSEGYRVVTATSGREALAVLSAGAETGLVLLDLMMPDMSGFEFLETKNGRDEMSTVPVVVVSAVASQMCASEALTGVAGFVGKPFQVDSLLGMARQHCV